MSKRIMNRVMCLAEDMGCLIFYQDTDSMHIRSEDVPLLAKEFEKKYGCPLIGDNLCQFHNDFDEFKDPDAYSDRLIINGKKHYIDRVRDTQGNTAYHVRCKGVTTKAILADAQGEALIVLYKKTFDGKEHTYDLVKGGPAFDMNEDLTIYSKPTFKREVKRLIPRGDLEWYIKHAEENRKKYFSK